MDLMQYIQNSKVPSLTTKPINHQYHISLKLYSNNLYNVFSKYVHYKYQWHESITPQTPISRDYFLFTIILLTICSQSSNSDCYFLKVESSPVLLYQNSVDVDYKQPYHLSSDPESNSVEYHMMVGNIWSPSSVWDPTSLNQHDKYTAKMKNEAQLIVKKIHFQAKTLLFYYINVSFCHKQSKKEKKKPNHVETLKKINQWDHFTNVVGRTFQHFRTPFGEHHLWQLEETLHW